jgi:hypothetical protein
VTDRHDDHVLLQSLVIPNAGITASGEQRIPAGFRQWQLGAANLMKVAANALTALTLQSMGEVLALLRKGGVDARAAFEVLTGSLFDGKVHKTYGGKIVESHYSPLPPRWRSKIFG